MRETDTAAGREADTVTNDRDALAAWLADWQPGQAPPVLPIPAYSPPPVAGTPAPAAVAPSLKPLPSCPHGPLPIRTAADPA